MNHLHRNKNLKEWWIQTKCPTFLVIEEKIYWIHWTVMSYFTFIIDHNYSSSWWWQAGYGAQFQHNRVIRILILLPRHGVEDKYSLNLMKLKMSGQQGRSFFKCIKCDNLNSFTILLIIPHSLRRRRSHWVTTSISRDSEETVISETI